MGLDLKSTAFEHNNLIPSEYTCEGHDTSPDLSWEGVPEGTKSFVLICDDPDIPETLRSQVPDLIWDHWVVFNIPATVRHIPSNTSCPSGATCGRNSFKRNDYGGPCPPNPSTHRYFFRLYALDTVLSLDPSVGKKEVLAAIKGHILDQAELVGKYIKKEFRK